MIYPDGLTEETFPRFVDNIKNRVNMVCWCWYKLNEDIPAFLDIAKTRYLGCGFDISCRGQSYLSIDKSDPFQIDEIPFNAMQKIIHSFLEVRELEL